ncbi:YbjQ family protein [Leptolyngbya sp. PCC 6406]|uniref:YbjQ family protein n=1 Tax=Leptolyngbya sp. PCC 6406 TaxID=1173264 RepID=UPI0002ABD369|nr:heavy metal-binding domain-containing protein [Leptolyngbya sp. PCC 6406]
MGEFIGLIIFAILLGLGYFVGSATERQHFKSLKQREYQTRQILINNIGAKTPLPQAGHARLFVGSVVISSDYFKTVVAGFVNIFGGRIRGFETLVERGRREAILRMKADAIAWGATEVVNVRLETSELGGQGTDQGVVAVEVIAYGTGIRP